MAGGLNYESKLQVGAVEGLMILIDFVIRPTEMEKLTKMLF